MVIECKELSALNTYDIRLKKKKYSEAELLKVHSNCPFYILYCTPTAEFLSSLEQTYRDAVLFDLALFTGLGR